MATPGYLEVIADACSDIAPNLIFNNAGFVATGWSAAARGHHSLTPSCLRSLRGQRVGSPVGQLRVQCYRTGEDYTSLPQSHARCQATWGNFLHIVPIRLVMSGTCGLRYLLCSLGRMPTPMTVMYGSTKAFLTEFAMSIAPEVHRRWLEGSRTVVSC